MIVLRADLSESPIDVASHEALVDHSAAGAVVSFAGVVRNHDGGRGVTRLEYSAHPSAAEVLAEVAADVAAASEGVRAIAVSHRIGVLNIGDAALVAAVERPELVRALRKHHPIWLITHFNHPM